jgi:hypothetical protein
VILKQKWKDDYILQYFRHLKREDSMPPPYLIRNAFQAICVESRLLYEDMCFWRPNGY